jgi:radical SAM superfamily enzyme YgiQ (UPF0313 family)
MKIGIYDVDSKIPNLALMKLSAYHKKKNDDVELYSPLFHDTYDKIYASKVFNFSDRAYLRSDMIIGGSGYNLKAKLPEQIEHIYPDYTLYPECDYSIGFITRGCIRNCEFCIVPKKEGKIRKSADLEEFTKDQERVMLLDNNLLAYENHIKELEKLRDSRKKIDFNQGLDIRLITEENAKILREIKIWKQIRFSLDHPKTISIVKKKMEILEKVGFSLGTFFFYVLIGFNTTMEQDLERVKFLRENYKCTIYIMPYNRANKHNDYVKDFKRWVNGYFYKYESFKDYQNGVRT